MKLIEPAQKPNQKEGFQKVIGQIQAKLPFGKTDEQAEEAIIARFMRGLDNRYVMVRYLPVEGSVDRFPPILIGPPGLILLNLSPVQGFFRAKEDTWWELSKSTQRYNPGKPNLIKQTQEYAEKLSKLLEKHEKTHPEVVPVLVFANPGVHIESTNPAVRISLMDAVENLISDIVASDEVLAPYEINSLSDTLEFLQNPDKAIPMGEGEDFFGRDLLEPEKKATLSMPKLKLPKFSLAAMEERFKFSPRQWLILEILMVLLILLLLAAIIYILIAF